MGTSSRINPQTRAETIKSSWNKIKRHEGYESAAYNDTLGYRTIGYGFKVADPNDVADRRLTKFARGQAPRIDREEAEDIGTAITAKTHDAIADLFTLDEWDKFSTRQRDALVNMGYQLGAAGVGRFKRTLGLLKAGRYREAGLEAGRSQWALQTPNRAAEVAIDLSNGTLRRDELPWIR